MTGPKSPDIATTGRFAPSTTGPAHPGTLLSALLCWLDARSRGARVELRLEDLDPDRCREAWAHSLEGSLAALGLDWDRVSRQSQNAQRYAEALDRLAAQGQLYPCGCSRNAIRAHALRAPDGGWRYPNRCRDRALPAAGWRACREPLRVRLPEGWVHPRDEAGLALSQAPAAAFGDPVVRRRDGAVAYHLASVVDDADSFVTRIVRGRDLATSSAIQVSLRRLLNLPIPVYRHHLLLLETAGDKLAKLHGSVSAETLLQRYDAPGLCGVLAFAAGLLEQPAPISAAGLLRDFDWRRVARADQVARWTGSSLEISSSSEASPGTPTRNGKP